ncbi:MAG TPA: histidine kinase [Pseudonocardiaceae bacterium]|nr:histidine kinase [Pseudonocardiaceae bacterium]
MRLRVVRKLAGLRQRDLPIWQQDGVIALFTLVIGVLLYTTDLAQLVPFGSGVPLWGRLLELTLMCGLELLRRRVPGGLVLATVGLAVDVALGVSLPVLFVYTDFLYAATLYGSRRTSRVMIGVAVLGPLGLLVGLLGYAHNLHVALVVTLGIVPFVITPVWWAAHVRQQRDVADAERANAAQLAKIAELDRRASLAAERGRMARDLHDVIAGHLSAIAIQSGAALAMADDPRTARTVLTSVRENSVHALEEMRAMIGLLRADTKAIEDETTAPARLAELSRLVASARAGGMQVTVESTVDGGELPVAIDLTAYRIAQEALTNTMKHAPGGRVRIQITKRAGVLTVEVGNDLHPEASAQAKEGSGHGLLNMRARADAVGGTLIAGPVGTGWLVRAELPVAEGRV